MTRRSVNRSRSTVNPPQPLCYFAIMVERPLPSSRSKPRSLTLAGVVGLLGVLASPAFAQTNVTPGVLAASQTWTVAGSPYRLSGSGITVPSGLTLVIEAGVQVEQASGGGGIDVEGGIRVEGTASNPVRFGDALGTQVIGRLTIRPTGTATVRFARWGLCEMCIVDEAGRSVVEDSEFDVGSYGIFYAGPGTARLSRVRFNRFNFTAVEMVGGVQVFADDVTVENSQRAFRAETARLNLTNSLFIGCSWIAVEFWRRTSGTVSGPHFLRKNTIVGGNIGVNVGLLNLGFVPVEMVDNVVAFQSGRSIAAGVQNTIITRNNLAFSNEGTGSSFWGFQKDSTDILDHPVTVNETSDFRPTSLSPMRGRASDGTDIGKLAFDGVETVPMRGWLPADTTFTRAGSPYRLGGDLTVPEGVELTVEPGVQVLFADNADANRSGYDRVRTEFRVAGGLRVNGTSADPVRFVTDGGRGNRDHHGLVVLPTATATVSHLFIQDADVGVLDEGSTNTLFRNLTVEDGRVGVQVLDGSPRFEASQMLSNDEYGLYVNRGSPSFFRVLIEDAGTYGVFVLNLPGQNARTVTARFSHLTVAGTRGTGVNLRSVASGSSFESSIVTGSSNWGMSVESGGTTVRRVIAFGNSRGSWLQNPPPVGNWGATIDPLFVGPRDYRLTDQSPARAFAVDGSDAGAFPYTGTAPAPKLGVISQSTTWSGDVIVTGDVTVERGRALTIAPGARVVVKPTDVLRSGSNTDRIEIRVDGRIRMVGTPEQRIRWRSESGARNSWQGLILGALSTGSEIEWVDVRDASTGLLVEGGFGSRVRYLDVSNGTWGVHVSGNPIITLDGIQTHNHTRHGMELRAGTESLTVTNLVSYDNDDHGLFVGSGTGTGSVTIDHATIVDNGDYGILTQSVTSGVRNSLVVGNGSFAISGPTVQATATYDNRWNWTGAGLISCTADFVDRPNGVFGLVLGSGCRDVGVTTPVRLDAEANPRVVQSISGFARPDLGAFEYQPAGNRYPVARFNTSTPTLVVTEGDTLLLDGRASSDPDGTIVDYAWNLGDGQYAEGATVAVSYATTQDVDVQLTVTDDDGYRDREVRRVITNIAPVANAGGNVAADLIELFAFDGRGSRDADGTIASYRWDFGDGNSGTGSVGLHRYAAVGVYTVTLTVTDNHGASDTDVAVATVGSGSDTVPPTIQFTPPTSSVIEGDPVVISASIFDASGVTSARVYYRSGGAFQSVPMTGGPTYLATIPAAAVSQPVLQYYIEATDGALPPNVGTDPVSAPATVNSRTVVPAAPPILIYAPVPDGRPFGTPVPITARATSLAGVARVQLFYRPATASTFTAVVMSDDGAGNYAAVIPAGAVRGTAVDYYLVASDTATPPRTTRSPLAGQHRFTVSGGGDTAGPAIVHAPVTAAVRAGQAVTVTASVSDPSGLLSVTLRYRRVGDPGFSNRRMTQVAPGRYEADIPGLIVEPPAVEYYIEAIDRALLQNQSVAPPTAPATPARLDVLRSFNLAAGDLVVTEIMADPTGDEAEREWFEVYNPTAAPIDLDGLRFVSGSDEFVVDEGAPVFIAPGDYAVFGRTRIAANNGDVDVDVVYDRLTFANGADDLSIEAEALVVDAVAYDASTYPLAEGRSLNLAASALDASSNDDARSWCAARTQWAGGDFGTPGRVNTSCADITPPDIAHEVVSDGQREGVAVALTATVSDSGAVASVSVFHRPQGGLAFSETPMLPGGGGLWFATLTSTAVARPAVEYYVVAEDTAGNQAFFPAMAPGVTLRFTVDRVFELVPGDLVISEVMADPSGDESQREWFELYNPTARAVDLDGLRFETSSGGFTVGQPGTVVPAGGYAVLGRSPDPAQNGGVAVDFAYVGLRLANDADRLRVLADGQAIDVLVWDGRFLRVEGRSLNLASTALDAASNDAPGAWCPSSAPLSGGDFGTPGAVNASCGDLTAPVISVTPVASPQPEGAAVTVTASVTDDREVAQVRLHYRPSGGPSGASYATATMNPTGRGTWFADISGGQVGRPGVEYYVSAADAARNVGTFPATAPGLPLSFAVDRAFAINPGDLVISEIMVRPSGSPSVREWFELFNATSRPLDLGGLTFDGGGVEGFTVDETLSLAPGDYMVFGRSTDTSTNGGVTVDYAYDGLGFANTADTLRVRAEARVVDVVGYDATYPIRVGRSLSLDPNAVDASSNDDGANWCFATAALAGGDFGTPGRVNDGCADESPPSIVHTPVADGQPARRPVPVTAQVTDEGTGLDAVRLYYRSVGDVVFTEVLMRPIGGDTYQGDIVAADTSTAGLEYYLRAVDRGPTPNETFAPLAGADEPYRFVVTEVDSAGPNLVHTAPEGPLDATAAVDLVVAIADPSGIDTASLVLEDDTRLPLTGDGLRFEVSVPPERLNPPELAYRFEARDPLGNEAQLPEDGLFTVAVRIPDPDAPAIDHTPLSEPQPADQPLTLVATIGDASGIAEARLRIRSAGARTFVALDLTAEPDAEQYRVEIDPALLSTETLEYFFEAVDDSEEQNLGRLPAGAPDTLFTVQLTGVGPEDLAPPLLFHRPYTVATLAQAPEMVPFDVTALDLSGIDEVRMFVRAGTEPFEAETMQSLGQNRFRVEIDSSRLRAEPGIDYYFEAVDATSAQNLAVLPEGGAAAPYAIRPPPSLESGGGCTSSGAAPPPLAFLVVVLALAWGRRRSA